jgi:hypothetical protein
VTVRASVLEPGGGSSEIPVADALRAAHRGTFPLVEGALCELGFLDRIVELYLGVVTDVVSPAAAARLRADGLERLHDVCTPDRVATVLAELDRRARPITVPLTRAIVGATGPDVGDRYFVCPRMFVRAQVPVRAIDAYPDLLAAPHLAGSLRPVGFHRDRDLTHPADTISLWAAVGRIVPGNSVQLMSREGGIPVVPSLGPGDVALFNADCLHASVPNDTDETRVGVTVRVVLGRRLRYGPGTHWRPYADARLLDTRFEAMATLQSRLTAAAFRRWRWRRRWEREQRRVEPTAPVPSLKR